MRGLILQKKEPKQTLSQINNDEEKKKTKIGLLAWTIFNQMSFW